MTEFFSLPSPMHAGTKHHLQATTAARLQLPRRQEAKEINSYPSISLLHAIISQPELVFSMLLPFPVARIIIFEIAESSVSLVPILKRLPSSSIF